MAGTAIAGKNGRVVVGGAIIVADKWKATLHGVDIPTTNFEDQAVVAGIAQTFTSGITGPLEADLEFNGFYNAAQLPFSAGVPNFFPGLYQPAGGIQLYPYKYGVAFANANPSGSFNFPVNIVGGATVGGMRILQSAVDCDVNGRVNLAVNAKSNGVFVAPSTFGI